jgi:hypothetical protein
VDKVDGISMGSFLYSSFLIINKTYKLSIGNQQNPLNPCLGKIEYQSIIFNLYFLLTRNVLNILPVIA